MEEERWTITKIWALSPDENETRVMIANITPTTMGGEPVAVDPNEIVAGLFAKLNAWAIMIWFDKQRTLRTYLATNKETFIEQVLEDDEDPRESVKSTRDGLQSGMDLANNESPTKH